MSVIYLPYDERAPDRQYSDLIGRILSAGRQAPTRQGPAAYTLMQQTMQFNLANGFPMITDRDVSGFWRKPIGELCAFINGATTLNELEAFGCDWWEPWATPELTGPLGITPGDIGPGSYGGAFRRFPSPAPGAPDFVVPFDQFAHLVQQIRELPHLRTHLVSPWVPLWNARGGGRKPATTISPCHGWVHVRILDGGLHLHMFQRSGDVPVGVPSNMIQYGALTLMLAHLTGHRADTFYHTISDAHIYTDQVAKAGQILRQVVANGPLPLPTVRLNDAGLAVADIHDFRAEHFDLADYNPYPAVYGIPVGV